ncbi:MAG: DUF1926 domain-containing protein, partial [Deltaproteobacteria bacterium]|nr:DUF1926 domain-containing protein [Deltaproteobacteria bacterium]
EYIDREGSLGRVYLPASSYMEMGEWSLPAPASKVFGELLEELKHWGEQGERIKRFLHGGTWRNFFAKYPEADWMHKRMLRVSKSIREKTASLAGDAALAKAAGLLYKGQCNDAYWHGIFGGLYLPHLRTKVYESLIGAEALIAPSGGHPSVAMSDVDADGMDEAILCTKDLNLFFSPSRGGALYELDYKPRAVNLSNTLSRWPEGYHHKLKERLSGGAAGKDAGAAESIHDRILVKEEGLLGHLKFDDIRRASFIDRFIGSDETLDAFSSNRLRDLGDFQRGAYEAEIRRSYAASSLILSRRGSAGGETASVSKEIRAEEANSFSVDYAVHAENGEGKRFGVEMNFLLPCCSGPACLYRFNGAGGAAKAGEAGLGSTGELMGINRLSLVDRLTGVMLTIETNMIAALWRFPVYTVSLSEAGFERIYQGSCLLFLFPLLRDGRLEVSFAVKAEGVS